MATLQCDNCFMWICGLLQFGSNRILRTWPEKAGGKEFPDVPESIAAAANEAHRCLSIDAHRAAVAMARAVVEGTAKYKGITQGGIAGKIDKLFEGGLISESMRDAAHEIRLTANGAAHCDLTGEPVTGEEAEEVISLMDAILERVFQEPARVARVRESRKARLEKSEAAPQQDGGQATRSGAPM